MDQDRPTDGRATEIARIAEATQFSEGAVSAMADALAAGNGSMAQFDHPELGGFGQWSSGGMLMIGAMFDHGLKARVARLAETVWRASIDGRLPRRATVGAGRDGAWWPGTLGRPASSGAQNGRRYAVFPETSRLAVESDGVVTLYETGKHRIGGVSQQQGSGATLRFTSQHGSVDLGELDEVGRETTKVPPRADAIDETPPARHAGTADLASSSKDEAGQSRPAKTETAASKPTGHSAIDMIRHLSDLHNDGILSEEEFGAKKAELLGRL